MSKEPMDRLSRREMLRRSAALIAGGAGLTTLAACASDSASQRVEIPDIPWPDERMQRKAPIRWEEPPVVSAPRSPTPTPSTGMPQVVSRRLWAKGDPVPRLMDRMSPIHRITIHHDGMTPFTSVSQSDAAARIEAIRAAHRRRDWGDIGYHYVIDPAGRVWEGRPISWQGAHVKDQNPGNLGICVLGNFQQQRPNTRQVDALERFIVNRMEHYGVHATRVYTHREIGSTLCPGGHLHAVMTRSRSVGVIARA